MGISEETRIKWDEYLDFVIDNQDNLNDWELEFIDDMWAKRSRGEDLTIRQSFRLNKIKKRIEE